MAYTTKTTSLIMKLKKSTLLNANCFCIRTFSIQAQKFQKDNYKLVVIGGGAGGAFLN